MNNKTKINNLKHLSELMVLPTIHSICASCCGDCNYINVYDSPETYCKLFNTVLRTNNNFYPIRCEQCRECFTNKDNNNE